MDPAQPLVHDPLHHPVEVIHRNAQRIAEQQRFRQQSLTLGASFARRQAFTRSHIAAIESRGNLPSSRALTQTIDGSITKIDFNDFLGLPQSDPNVQPTARQLLHQELWGSDLILKRA